MNRLQKKCFAGSAIFHVLLLAGVLVGAAFLPAPSRPQVEEGFMTLTDIPDILVDQNVMGGNGVPVRNNAAAALPTPAPRVIPPPPAAVPPAQPKPAEPAKTSEPVELKEPENAQESENQFIEKPKPRKIEVNLDKKVKVEPKKPSKEDDKKAREAREAKERKDAEADAREARAQAEAARSARREAFNNIGKSFDGLKESIGQGTDISMPGGTGPAYAGYSMAIKKIYDDAWRRPSDASDSSNVVVEIVISRDGRVVSSKIVSKSSNSVLDKSVKEALDRVRKVPPFPEGARDAERTFRINYNLKSKTDIG